MSTFSTVLFCLLAAFVKQGLAGYSLVDDYAPSNFFSMFSFFDTSDPTHGFVSYLDQNNALSQGLIGNSASSVYMGVDHQNVASNAGRSSVRITSNKAYNEALVILDASHMPEGCGTWPAFWMVGPNWPNSGEIDIIEGVNEQLGNAMTLHTADGCTIDNSGFTGSLQSSNCYVNAAGQYNNQGCGISNGNSNSYGSGFNANQGGVYATEWTTGGISIWFFPRNSIPGDISSGNPNPGSWGEPVAHYGGGCNFGSMFSNLQIVFDTTFCGDWAGAVWGSSSCASKASTCQDYVQNNPSAFANAYWTVNSLKVYQDYGSKQSPNVPATSLTTAGPTGVASSVFSTIAPIPVSTAPPFSSTASFWNGDIGNDEPATTAAAAKPVQTTLATITSKAPVTSFWDGIGGWKKPTPAPTAAPAAANAAVESSGPAPKTSSTTSLVFWDGYDAPDRRLRREKRHARHLLAHQNRKIGK